MIRAFLAALFALSAVPVAAQPAGGETIAIGTTYTITSKVLGEGRRVTVRLPAGYAEEPQMRFPVVYLLDGGPEQDFPHIAGIAQSRDMNWSFDRFILVGIQTVNRRHEVSPTVRAENVSEYETALGATPGGAEQFRAFIASDVKPWVKANFRTSGHDAVMGESLAGLFVVDTLLTRPDLFDDWIAVSPSLWWDDMKLARGAAGMMQPGEERVYVTVANEGYRHEEGVERFVDALRSSAPEGWRWAYVPLGDSETHGTIYHTAALDAFRLLYGSEHREYRPDSRLLGREAEPRSAEEQALLDEVCTTDNTLSTTPEATRSGRDRLFYRCLKLDLGPRAREGNLTP